METLQHSRTDWIFKLRTFPLFFLIALTERAGWKNEFTTTLNIDVPTYKTITFKSNRLSKSEILIVCTKKSKAV